MPPMNSSGMNTAISEKVIDMMVKPIWPAPLSAASNGGSPCLDVAHDVLDHDDRVVDDEADGDGEAHQRQIVEAVAQHVHHAEGADQRQRHGDAGNDGRPQVAQEQEDHHHHQADGEQQGELHVGDRVADRLRAVGHQVDMDRSAGSRPQARHHAP